MIFLHIIYLNLKKKTKKKNSRSHKGGVGCHWDEIHFKIDDPRNWYPSWQIYWIVSFVVRSGWIISPWETNGGEPHVFSRIKTLRSNELHW